MEINKKYKFKNSVGAYCLQININGEPDLVNKLAETIDNEIKKPFWETVSEI